MKKMVLPVGNKSSNKVTLDFKRNYCHSGFMKILNLLLGLVLVGCKSIPIDPSVHAQEANDATVIIEGCGFQPVAGYTYCTPHEGDHTARDFLVLHSPPIEDCGDNDSCVSYMIMFPNGHPAIQLAVPKGETRTMVKWSDLTGKDTFDRNDRGLWAVFQIVLWEDGDGAIRNILSEGEIRLRVIREGYNPLRHAKDSNWFATRWKAGEWKMGQSTSGRTGVWK